MVSVHVRMPHPLQMLHRNHSEFRNSVKVKLGIKVMKLEESLIGWEITVIDQGSECHLIFVRGRLHIAE